MMAQVTPDFASESRSIRRSKLASSDRLLMVSLERIGAGSRPFQAGNRILVEAGGQQFRGFRRGLDYAFIRVPRRRVDAERVIRLSAI